MRSDPRPNTDKAYMNQCVRFLIKFLSEHQYDHLISPKMLARPMKKDFASIVAFLFRQIDANFRFSEKIEDDVSTVYRQLRYPFSISKTALVAVGSPHTWPSLLASLTWLVDILMYDETRQQLAQEEAEDPAFFDYLSKGYKTYMNGDDDHWLSLEKQIMDQMGTTQEDLQMEIDMIAAKNEELKQEIQALKQAKSSLPELTARKKDYVGDLQKFDKLVQQLKEHKARLEGKLQHLQSELAAKELELTNCRTEIKRLKHRIETQAISTADVQHMAHRHAQLKEQVRQGVARREELQTNAWELEREIASETDNLRQSLAQYHKVAADLKLIPMGSAKNSMGRCFELEVDSSNNAVSFSQSLHSQIRPGLVALKKNRIERTNAAWDRALELQAHVDQLNETLASVDAKKEEIDANVLRVKNQQEFEEEKLRKALSIKANELEEIEHAIQTDRDLEGMELSPPQEQVNQAEAEYEMMLQQHQKEYNIMSSCLAQAFISATDIKNEIDADICDLEAFLTNLD